MNRGGAGSAGYTIVETMIFLAVSGAMFLSAMLFMSGQQRKNEFAVGIRDFQSQITDIMNDVSTGFYNSTGNFTCDTASPGSPTIGSGPGFEQGTNDDCIFVGRVIQFAPDSNPRTAVLHTLVGRRQIGSPATDVRTLTETAPVLLDQAASVIQLPNGLTIQKITHGAGVSVGSVAFVSRFAGNSGSGGITGTQDIDLIPVKDSTLLMDRGSGASVINNQLLNSIVNPSTGVTVCFRSGGTNQYAIILLGGPGRQLSTELKIGNGDCP